MPLGFVNRRTLYDDVESQLNVKHRLLTDSCKCLLWVIIALVIVLSVASGLLTALFNLPRSQEQPGKQFRFCLRCSDLPQTSQSSLDMHINDAKVVMCCTRNASKAVNMLHMQTEKMTSLDMQEAPAEKTDNFMVSAHKYLKCPQKDEDKKTLRINTYIDPKYEHVENVDVTSIGLKVKYPGLYYVYKSVYFVPASSSTCKELADSVFSSTLCKRNDNGEQELLTSSHTCCPDCTQNRETAFTGGIFSLDKGDIIQVTLSEESSKAIYFSGDVTFVGLMMIQDPAKRSNRRQN